MPHRCIVNMSEWLRMNMNERQRHTFKVTLLCNTSGSKVLNQDKTKIVANGNKVLHLWHELTISSRVNKSVIVASEWNFKRFHLHVYLLTYKF